MRIKNTWTWAQKTVHRAARTKPGRRAVKTVKHGYRSHKQRIKRYAVSTGRRFLADPNSARRRLGYDAFRYGRGLYRKSQRHAIGATERYLDRQFAD